MDYLPALGLATVVVAIFDILALRFGVDSRPTIDDERPAPLAPRWS